MDAHGGDAGRPEFVRDVFRESCNADVSDGADDRAGRPGCQSALNIVDAHPQARLAPPVGSSERAHFYKWLMWLATGLDPALSMYLHPGKWTPDEPAQAALKVGVEAKVAALFEILEEELRAHGGPWLTGEAYSALDANAFVLCRWSRRMVRPGA